MTEAANLERGRSAGTGLIYSEKMDQHLCWWDPNMPESPARFTSILQRSRQLGLVSRCLVLPERAASSEELCTLHTQDLVDLLASTSLKNDEDELKAISTRYFSIFIHPSTYELAKLASGCAIDLVEAVVTGRVQNGMAIVRPPGHHALNNSFCGYCFFNNVGLAVRHALDQLGLKRVLVVDWDVHHGQATQRMFYDDPRVIYFSAHRYEFGNSWPFLRESDYHYVGEGAGRGYNFNVPLNEVGQGNSEYLAMLHQVLMPVAYQWSPELVVVSAGYDSALGDPKGRMELTPAFYAQMTSHLMNLAGGKVAVVLEGGYCIESLAESAALTLRTLLGDPAPRLLDPIHAPSLRMCDTLLNLIYAQRSHWSCLSLQGSYSKDQPATPEDLPRHVPKVVYLGGDNEDWEHHTKEFPTFTYPTLEQDLITEYSSQLARLRQGTTIEVPPTRVYIAATTPTTPVLKGADIRDGLHHMQLSEEKGNQLRAALRDDLLSDGNFQCVNPLLQVVDGVCAGAALTGVAHVGGGGQPSPAQLVGYAAQLAITHHQLDRVLIVDWTGDSSVEVERQFECEPRVMYMSVGSDRLADSVGKAQGVGFTVNIPWKKTGCSDAAHLVAMLNVVLPIAYQFDPQLVLMVPDSKGGQVTQAGNIHLVRLLTFLAGGRAVVVFEDDDLNSPLSLQCLSVLLGDSVPVLAPDTTVPGQATVQVIRNVIAIHKNHWTSLCFQVALPEEDSLLDDSNQTSKKDLKKP